MGLRAVDASQKLSETLHFPCAVVPICFRSKVPAACAQG